MIFDLWSLESDLSRQTPKRLFIWGGLFVLTAIAVVIFPQILVALAATLLLLAGISLLTLGWWLRKLDKMACYWRIGYHF